jgi:hypothetical protein
MGMTAEKGFEKFLGWLTPTAADREKAASHRASIEAKLNAKFGLYRMFESGSFKHGTGVSKHSDVDYFVSLKSDQPSYSSSTLTAVKEALQERFPNTSIHTSRPAVVLEFGQGYERVEVIPAYAKNTVTESQVKFEIPGVVGAAGWLESTPEAHVEYVNDCNKIEAVKGGTKKLARLAKAWKYYRDVPISSFYLEMRAAEYMTEEKSVILPLDIYYFLKRLKTNGLAAMNDPTGATGRIHPCSSDTKKADALSKLNTALGRAEKAKDYYEAGKTKEAFEQWNLLFNYEFPSYS